VVLFTNAISSGDAPINSAKLRRTATDVGDVTPGYVAIPCALYSRYSSTACRAPRLIGCHRALFRQISASRTANSPLPASDPASFVEPTPARNADGMAAPAREAAVPSRSDRRAIVNGSSPPNLGELY